MSRSRLLSFCLAALLFSARADAAWITIGWDRNTESDLAGYIVAYGTSPGSEEVTANVGTATNWTMSTATVGVRYYFRVYAYNTSGLRSAPSTEVSALVTSNDTTGPFTVDHTALNFTAVRAGVRISTVYSPAQSVVVTPNVGASTAWKIASQPAWLTITPSTGVGTATITAAIRAASVPLSGTQASAIVITAGSSSVSIPVTLTVKQAGTTSSPLGAFDTPVDGTSNVRGAVPVTGWALDDVEVTKVQIFRDPVPGEPGLIYLGDATFVPGARPDVEAGFATWPLNYRAGWGFMLLTNMLPDVPARAATGGNGTFRLHAYAVDAEGGSAILGTKTIQVANAGATQPFGTIDTPGQGGTVSGRAYVNFGWVISPGGVIPTDGSTITVLVDGVAVGHPQYNFYREDIGAAFVGYANSAGPVGFFVLDTTTLSNGIHTISWVATDSNGVSSGLGSRFFTVLNDSTSAMTLAVKSATYSGVVAGSGDAVGQPIREIDALPVQNTTVEVSRTADTTRPVETLAPDWWSGAIDVHTVEAEPIEVRLGAADGQGGTYKGYIVGHGGMRPLPLGSTLDQSEGVFTWQPGAGFVGHYELVFVHTSIDGRKTRVPVRIVIAPAFETAPSGGGDR
jgi:hypothetical protein